jgi:hypothetical protein
MKIRCLNTEGYSGLTAGKEYEALKSGESRFYISNDTGYISAYSERMFEEVPGPDPTLFHKHRDIMIAYANNKNLPIQLQVNAEGLWKEVDHPQWADHLKYRIKPDNSEKIKQIKAQIAELQEQVEELE